MSLSNWNGLDEFLAGQEPEEWFHITIQDKPDYIREHEEALEQVQGYRDAYMLAYGLEGEHLINSSTKYETGEL